MGKMVLESECALPPGQLSVLPTWHRGSYLQYCPYPVFTVEPTSLCWCHPGGTGMFSTTHGSMQNHIASLAVPANSPNVAWSSHCHRYSCLLAQTLSELNSVFMLTLRPSLHLLPLMYITLASSEL